MHPPTSLRHCLGWFNSEVFCFSNEKSSPDLLWIVCCGLRPFFAHISLPWLTNHISLRSRRIFCRPNESAHPVFLCLYKMLKIRFFRFPILQVGKCVALGWLHLSTLRLQAPPPYSAERNGSHRGRSAPFYIFMCDVALL